MKTARRTFGRIAAWGWIGIAMIPAVQASELCDAERSVATTIAKARDRGITEAKVDEQLKQTFTDPTQQQGVMALANVIYSSPDLAGLPPDQIGGAIGSQCEDHPPPKQ